MSDAQQKLITTGCMLTYEKNNLRFNIEYAANHGYQKVKAWDRNIVCDSGTTYQNHLFLFQPIRLGSILLIQILQPME